MSTIQILTLMTILGALTFMVTGFIIGNAIEPKEDGQENKTLNVTIVLMILGILSFLIGFFGILILEVFFKK
jgi:hypothetical protein